MEQCNGCEQIGQELEKAMDQVSGLATTVRMQAGKLAQQAAIIADRENDDPKAHEVRELLNHWRKVTGHPRARVEPGTKRWQIAAKAVKDEGLERCKGAIEGIAAKPYVTAHGRKPDGLPSQRYDDVEYALKDETTVDRAIKYRAQVLGASLEDVFDAMLAAGATSDFYACVLAPLLEARNRLDDNEPPSNVIPIRKEAA